MSKSFCTTGKSAQSLLHRVHGFLERLNVDTISITSLMCDLMINNRMSLL
jgi:hypothetical protein